MKLIVIHGPIASGKLTTARELATLTGLPLFHNHLVVDTVLSVFPFGSEPFIRLRDLFWSATFEAAAATGQSLIFTFAPEPTVPRDFLTRTSEQVQQLGGEMAFIELQVSDAEQDVRLGNADRKAYRKLSDLDTLAELRRQGQTDPYPMPAADVIIDTQSSRPKESALVIATSLGLLTG